MSRDGSPKSALSAENITQLRGEAYIQKKPLYRLTGQSRVHFWVPLSRWWNSDRPKDMSDHLFAEKHFLRSRDSGILLSLNEDLFTVIKTSRC